ncbi:sensor histidine kinase [Sinosporangium siamense]|uniref:histidine kinase n=1 Tax=Sinosporangium siamense TaxID=1367973 RepID=A0A919RHC5_9ACTN|nr:histidine kinase [Sinosporangium siamense]GII92414.1 two-component sensor histidine kinase [Sinosporangium siamense]
MNPGDRPARITALSRWSTVPADAVLAAALFLTTLGPGQVLPGPPWLLALQTALVAPLAWRRLAPMTVMGLIGLAAAVQWTLDVQLPADAALLVAMYTVAAHRPWRRTLVAAVALEGGVLMAAARWAPPGQFPFTAAALSAMAAVALMSGLWMRVRRAYVTSLEHDREQRARLAVAEERARMTRDMHDIVTHNLSVMVALADSAAYVRHSAPDRAAAAMEQIAATGRQALQDMRRSLSTDRTDRAGSENRFDEMLQPAPGIAELGPLAERMRATGLATRVRVAGDIEAVPAAAQLTIYRLVQEALTNTLRHAPGARAEVRVEASSHRAEVEVIDVRDPVAAGASVPRSASPQPATAAGTRVSEFRGDGRGIAGMRERVASYGGSLDAGPVPGGGWRVLAVLNLDAPQ